MSRDLLRRQNSEKTLVAALKEGQESSRESISLSELPFDVSAELGEVLYVESKSPGVYFLSTRGRTYGLCQFF